MTGQRVLAVSAGDHCTASPSPPTAPSGAGAVEAEASWATATSRTSCCRRRSRPLLGSASSLCRLEAPQPRRHRRRRRLELGRWRLWPVGPRRRAEPAAAQEDRGLGWPARRRCVGWSIHSLAITADGAVWSWGGGAVASWATATGRDQLLPKKVEALAGQRVVAVSAGVATASPSPPTAPSGAGAWRLWPAGPRRRAAPAAAQEDRGLCWPARRRCVGWSRHSLASTADGAVFTWGRGEDGCLGHGEDEFHDQLSPKRIEVWSRQPTIA